MNILDIIENKEDINLEKKNTKSKYEYNKKYVQKWNEKNKEKIKTYKREYYQKYRENLSKAKHEEIQQLKNIISDLKSQLNN